VQFYCPTHDVVGGRGVPDGPPDLEALVDRPVRAAEVPAEQRQGVLDELAMHEAHGRLLRHLFTASPGSRRNGMQATDSVLTAKEAAAALGVTVSYLRHDADRLYVEMLAATSEGFILPWSGEPPPISTLTGVATASPSGSGSIEDVMVLNAVHTPALPRCPSCRRS
jgi:hypothetical protein